MALFGKKKKEEITPESLGFGFPAAEKKKEIEGVTQTTPPPRPETTPAAPMPAPTAAPAPRPMGNQPMMPAPQPIEAKPAPTQARQQPETLKPRPAIQTMPEEIRAPTAPTIQKLRPHVFLKISKYKEVMSSIDRIMNHIKDLNKVLKNMKDVEDKEALRIKESEELLAKMEEVAETFDKIFSNPEK